MQPERAQMQPEPITALAISTIESLLDKGQLWVKLFANEGFGPARFYKVRRNGATKTWKTKPGFHVPIRYGFRGTGAINPGTTQHFFWCEGDPNGQD